MYRVLRSLTQEVEFTPASRSRSKLLNKLINVFVPNSTISYDDSDLKDVFVLFDTLEEDYEGKTPFQKRTSNNDSCNITLYFK